MSGGNALEYYYFFYEWEVEQPSTFCAGPRTEANVFVGPVGVGEQAGAQGVHVFPNPADALLTVSFEATVGEVRVELMDITGRVVLDRRASAGAGRVDLDVTTLAAGEYTVRVQRGSGRGFCFSDGNAGTLTRPDPFNGTLGDPCPQP